MLGLTLGLLLVGPRLIQRLKIDSQLSAKPKDSRSDLTTGFFIALSVGLVAYALPFLLPRLGENALASTLLNTLQQFVLLAVCLLAYKYLLEKSALGWLVVLGVGVLFPAIALLSSGIISIGVTTTVLLFMFFLSCRGLDKRTTVLIALAAYVGLSLFVPYIRSRDTVRLDVREGASLAQRLESAALIFEDVTPFSITNPEHLNLIGARLDNNAVIGIAVLSLRSRIVPYALGRTFLNIPLALIPRALWPNKPSLAGGSAFVTHYTGLIYAEGTSAGVGPVMEGYANFGTAGVFALLMFYGIVLVIFDAYSHAALLQGDIRTFSIWFLTGSYLVNPSEFLATALAGMVGTFLILKVFFWTRTVARRQKSVL